jgi:protein SCO1
MRTGENFGRPFVAATTRPPARDIRALLHSTVTHFMKPWHELVRLSTVQRIACMIFATALMMNCPPAPAGTSAVTIGGPFTLMASDGTTVTDRTYRGKWLLVFFGYASCPDICPTTLFEIATALQKLGPDAAKLQPIFITVDPQRDTPQVLEDYTRSFDQRIVGLTGSRDQIAAAAQEYGAYHVRRQTGLADEDYVIAHSSYIYLMNPLGQFVQGVDAGTSGDRLAEMLHELMAQ